MKTTIWEGHLLPKGKFTYVDASGDRELDFTQELLQSMIDNTKMANLAGKRTLGTDGHPKPAEVNDKTKGYGIDYYLGDDGLYGKVEVHSAEFAKRLQSGEIQEVSPVISMQPFKMPDGTMVNPPWIPQIGFTVEPRYGKQNKIKQLFNSMGWSQAPAAPQIEPVEGGLVFYNPCKFTLSNIDDKTQTNTGGNLMADPKVTKPDPVVDPVVEDPKKIEFSAPTQPVVTPDPKIAILEAALATQGNELKGMRRLEFTRQANELAGKQIAVADVPIFVDLCEHLHTDTALTFSAPAVDGKETKLTGLDALKHIFSNAPEHPVIEGRIAGRPRTKTKHEDLVKFVFDNPAIFADGEVTEARAKEIVDTLGSDDIIEAMKAGE